MGEGEEKGEEEGERVGGWGELLPALVVAANLQWLATAATASRKPR